MSNMIEPPRMMNSGSPRSMRALRAKPGDRAGPNRLSRPCVKMRTTTVAPTPTIRAGQTPSPNALQLALISQNSSGGLWA